jgi:DNA processing protein
MREQRESAPAEEELVLALLASRAAGGARRATKQLLQGGRDRMWALVEQLSTADHVDAESTAARLHADGVRALLCDDPDYPDRLRRFVGAPPHFFYKGRIGLVNDLGIGVCGSRNASAEGLRAAHACGEDAVKAGAMVVSGYAKGVDTEAHLAALKSGGNTVAVLAEGIDHFRVKNQYLEFEDAANSRMLVLSQFPPAQPWTVGAAMTRNQVVVGISAALIVIEAGETGGTLKAGETALRGGRPVFVLQTGPHSVGNEQLLAAGAHVIDNRAQLLGEFGRLGEDSTPQLPFG